MTTVLVKNVGSGPFPVGGEMLLPEETRRVPVGIYESVKSIHPQELVIVGGQTQVEVAGSVEDNAAPGATLTEAKATDAEGPYAGQVFVLAGSFEAGREAVTQHILELGGTVESDLTDQTHYLVAGKIPGKKVDRAKEMNVIVITEQDLEKLGEAETDAE